MSKISYMTVCTMDTLAEKRMHKGLDPFPLVFTATCRGAGDKFMVVGFSAMGCKPCKMNKLFLRSLWKVIQCRVP